MHPCLKIDEILVVIAQDASMSDDMLLAMALTCRTFYGAAMGERWRELNEIRKLLYSFPHEVVMIEYESELGRWFWGFKRVPTPVEWGRFNYYAKRVQVMRELRLDDEDTQTSQQPPLLDVMMSHFKGSPAFPNLRVLHCRAEHRMKSKYLALFLQPKLRHLSFLSSTHPTGFIENSIKVMAKIAPFTMELVVDEKSNIVLGSAELSVLAEMQSLRCLSFPLEGNASLRDNIPSPAFPALRYLNVSTRISNIFGGDFRDTISTATLIELLHLVSACSLWELSVDVSFENSAPSVHSIHSLLTSVATFSKSLKTCKIRISAEPRWDGPGLTALFGYKPISVGHALSPLITLGGSMSSLDLSTVCLDMTSNDFITMLFSWPNLVNLRLGHFHRKTTSTIPLSALGVVVYSCPKLEYLGVVVQDADEGQLLMPGLGQHPVLKTLAFRCNMLRDIERVAEFLTHSFPFAGLSDARVDGTTCEDGAQQMRELRLRVQQLIDGRGR